MIRRAYRRLLNLVAGLLVFLAGAATVAALLAIVSVQIAAFGECLAVAGGLGWLLYLIDRQLDKGATGG